MLLASHQHEKKQTFCNFIMHALRHIMRVSCLRFQWPTNEKKSIICMWYANNYFYLYCVCRLLTLPMYLTKTSNLLCFHCIEHSWQWEIILHMKMKIGSFISSSPCNVKSVFNLDLDDKGTFYFCKSLLLLTTLLSICKVYSQVI